MNVRHINRTEHASVVCHYCTPALMVRHHAKIAALDAIGEAMDEFVVPPVGNISPTGGEVSGDGYAGSRTPPSPFPL